MARLVEIFYLLTSLHFIHSIQWAFDTFSLDVRIKKKTLSFKSIDKFNKDILVYL